MQGGSGDDSYAKNSQLQNYYFHALAKAPLAEAIRLCSLFDQPAAECFHIADFGCSGGRNTLEAAEFIVEHIQRKRGEMATNIQYFFSDVPTNDFNSLFQLLKSPVIDSSIQKLQHFYAAGVPGSFYTRLFPEGSLDFAISMQAVHWLSRVPPAVLDRTSPAWNGDHIWIHGERPKVAEAYAQQFQSDMKMFLNCRAAELAKGAILMFVTVTRTEEHPKGEYYDRFDDMWSGSFESAWDEMVSKGVLDAKERDMFNVPQYNFHRAELELALKDVPELEVVKIELTNDKEGMPHMQKLLQSDPERFAETWSGIIMAVMKPMMQQHIGEKKTAIFSQCLVKSLAKRVPSVKSLQMDFLVTVLRRR